jgi:hypothetical protein
MCAVLQSKGIAAGRLLVLGAGNAGPLGLSRDATISRM